MASVFTVYKSLVANSHHFYLQDDVGEIAMTTQTTTSEKKRAASFANFKFPSAYTHSIYFNCIRCSTDLDCSSGPLIRLSNEWRIRPRSAGNRNLKYQAVEGNLGRDWRTASADWRVSRPHQLRSGCNWRFSIHSDHCGFLGLVTKTGNWCWHRTGVTPRASKGEKSWWYQYWWYRLPPLAVLSMAWRKSHSHSIRFFVPVMMAARFDPL